MSTLKKKNNKHLIERPMNLYQYSEIKLKKLSLEQLKYECKRRNIKIKNTKKKIIDEIINWKKNEKKSDTNVNELKNDNYDNFIDIPMDLFRYSKKRLHKLSKTQLIYECKKRNIRVGNTKKIMVDELLNWKKNDHHHNDERKHDTNNNELIDDEKKYDTNNNELIDDEKKYDTNINELNDDKSHEDFIDIPINLFRYSEKRLNKLSLTQLRYECKKRNIKIKNTKKKMINELLNWKKNKRNSDTDVNELKNNINIPMNLYRYNKKKLIKLSETQLKYECKRRVIRMGNTKKKMINGLLNWRRYDQGKSDTNVNNELSNNDTAIKDEKDIYGYPMDLNGIGRETLKGMGITKLTNVCEIRDIHLDFDDSVPIRERENQLIKAIEKWKDQYNLRKKHLPTKEIIWDFNGGKDIYTGSFIMPESPHRDHILEVQILNQLFDEIRNNWDGHYTRSVQNEFSSIINSEINLNVTTANLNLYKKTAFTEWLKFGNQYKTLKEFKHNLISEPEWDNIEDAMVSSWSRLQDQNMQKIGQNIWDNYVLNIRGMISDMGISLS